MRMEKVVITLEPEEVIEVQRIVLDEDQDGALTFLRKTIERKIKTVTARCDCSSDCCR